MTCPECQDRIMEMQEGTLPTGDRPAVEGHMAVCDACRRFAQRLGRLDAVLAEAHSVPGLPADFKARLMQRIDREAPRLSAEAIEARKREIEAEYHTIMAGLPHRVWLARLPLLLDVLGLISMALIAWSILRSIPGAGSSLEALGLLMVKVTTGTLAWIWAAISLCIGLVWAFKRRPMIRLYPAFLTEFRF